MTKVKLNLPLKIDDIKQILPHRFPFLLIDGVTHIDSQKNIIAYRQINADEPFFAGHFPGFPIMPGVLQIEAIAQAGGILTYFTGDFDPEKHIALLVGVEKAKFRKPVLPGDRLIIQAEIISSKRGLCKFKGTTLVNQEKTCEAIVTAAVRAK
ncbi:MAG: 3-hydroxyacyl-ACP dehydratase FabZ [bacterium]|nr:3-hydroxyacyl-ACP dehydratase FabZ [bacterium]